MQRPAGVILTAITLGLLAGLELLFVAILTFAAVVLSGSEVAAPQPSFAIPIIIGLGVFLVLLAAWAILTLIGLIRLREWARRSILVITGCLLALSLVSVAGTAIAASILPPLTPSPDAPDMPPYTMHIVLLFEALLHVISGILAGWWLVYFNLRSTAAYFLAEYGNLPPETPV
jgi:hypothetical protein